MIPLLVFSFLATRVASEAHYQQQQQPIQHQQTYTIHSQHLEYPASEYQHSRRHQTTEKPSAIIRSNFEQSPHGYHFSYEADNGIKVQEAGKDDHGTVAQGAYSYTGDDGHVYTVTYTADEHGFHAHGDHFPTPPPLSKEIAEALEQNAAEEAAGIFDDGSYPDDHKTQHHQHHQHSEHHHQAAHHHEAESYSHQPQKIIEEHLHYHQATKEPTPQYYVQPPHNVHVQPRKKQYKKKPEHQAPQYYTQEVKQEQQHSNSGEDQQLLYLSESLYPQLKEMFLAQAKQSIEARSHGNVVEAEEGEEEHKLQPIVTGELNEEESKKSESKTAPA